MNGKRINGKDKSYKVNFNGRYIVTNEQANANVAFRLLRLCNSRKNVAKTKIVFNLEGFYIGTSLPVLNIKKKMFYTEYIFDFFIFKETPQCTIILEREHNNMWMSYFRFVNDGEANDFVTYLENNKHPSTKELTENKKYFHSMSQEEIICPMFKDDTSDLGSPSSYLLRSMTKVRPLEILNLRDSKNMETVNIRSLKESDGSASKILSENCSLEETVKTFFSLDNTLYEAFDDVKANAAEANVCGTGQSLVFEQLTINDDIEVRCDSDIESFTYYEDVVAAFDTPKDES